MEALTFPPASGKSFIMGADEAMESELGLGELAGLTVANEADILTYDVSVPQGWEETHSHASGSEVTAVGYISENAILSTFT